MGGGSPARQHARTQLRRAEDGFTLIELIVAMFLLTGGIAALIGTLDRSRDLTSQSELKQAAVHRAQREVERVLALPYASIGHQVGSIPAATSGADDPRSRLVAPAPGGSGTYFKWDLEGGTGSEQLVEATAGEVSLGPEKFDDGRLTGDVHRFVSWASDPSCVKPSPSAALCAGTQTYKRVTVAVRVNGPGKKLKTVWSSSVASDPDAAPADSTTTPVTECLDESGTALEECATATQGTPLTLFLHDTPAPAGTRQPIAASHPTHPTVAPVGLCDGVDASGCPVPDLMSGDAPPSSTTPPPLFDYSSEVAGGYSGGRALRRDTACSGTPSSQDNTKGAMWVTSPLAAATELTGAGGMSIFTHTLGGVAAGATLCLAVYSVPESIANLVVTPPKELGRASHSLESWPRTATRISFPFSFREAAASVPAGQRLGVRLWVDSAAGADVALVYDHPSYDSYVQLNQPGG